MFDDKLNKKENQVMSAVFTLSGGDANFLCTPDELLALLPAKAGFDEEFLENVLRALELDGYFHLTPSERKGEKTYVVHLMADGLAFRRSDFQRKRKLYFKLGLTVFCAVLSFLIGVFLKAVF